MQYQIEIALDDLKFITYSEYERILGYVLHNSFCFDCSQYDRKVEMVNVKVFLKFDDNILFRGLCKHCRTPIARLVETGESRKYILRTKTWRLKYSN